LLFTFSIERNRSINCVQIQQKVAHEEVLRDGPRPQRSPSAPLFGSPLCEHSCRVMSHTDASGNLYQGQRNTSRRQRSLSADGANTSLRRGRPNTIKSGLPSPVNHQILDPTRFRILSDSSANIDATEPRLTIDTSPILNKSASQSSESEGGEFVPPCHLVHQISKESVSSLAVDELSDNALDQAFIGSVLDGNNIISAHGVDLDVTGSSASIVDEGSLSLCSTGSDVDVAGAQTPSTSVDQWRPVDPMERFVVIPDRQSSHAAVAGCGGGAPKIKPSLMPSTVTSRLLGKGGCCSPRVCGDSPVSSGRLVARSKFIDPHS